MRKIIATLLLALVFASCADDKKETEDHSENELSFTSKTVEKKLDDCDPEKGKCTFISLVYPVGKNDEKTSEKINKTIEEFLVEAIDYQDEGELETPEELVTNFIRNYKETAQDFPEYELPWEATINGKLVYRSSKIISIKFNTDIFTGGAHGYRSTKFLNFNPKNGKVLTMNELFTSEFIDFVEKDFRKRKNIPMDQNINSTGMFFENDEFHLPQNIGFSEEKVILHYNAYEIAPYADGNFILSYLKSEITRFLKLKESIPKA